MRPRHGLAVLLLLLPGLARAAEAPERLLPAGTQVYLRWDGIDAHRAAYNRSALGRMMQGDTGTFLTGVFNQVQEGVGALLTVEQLLGGAAPEKLQKMQADAAETAKLLPLLGHKGFILAGELRRLDPPEGQLTLIVPDAGTEPKPLFGPLRLVAALAKVEVKEKTLAGRKVSYLDLGPLQLAWWSAGPHAVVTFGTGGPEGLVRALSPDQGPRLDANPLFRRVRDFDRFETNARAFVDAASLLRLAASRGPQIKKLLADLGLDGLRSAVLYSGFDGLAERGLAELEVAGPRKGLLALLEGKPFRLGDVPPLPPDVISWSMTNLDLGVLYDTALKAVTDVMRVVNPDAVAQVRAFPHLANAALGIDLRKDLLASLGDRFVHYNSPSEGPFNLGMVLLFSVKDEKKLEESLDQLIKALSRLTGIELRVRKRTYQGATVREVHARQQGFVFVPTYAIHKGWLVVSLYPQSAHGYLARAAGTLPAWKPSGMVRESLRQLPQEFISIAYSDPRPSLRQVLSLGPLIAGAVASFNPDLNLDVGSVPNTQEVTRHLFPNVAVTTDDGKVIRQESRASLSLPFDLTGIDTYGVVIVFSLARIGAM